MYYSGDEFYGDEITSPTERSTAPRTRRLECCCCGGDAGIWQQWWNRDTGYGLCRACALRIGKKETIEEMNDLYGIEGIHRAPTEKAV